MRRTTTAALGLLCAVLLAPSAESAEAPLRIALVMPSAEADPLAADVAAGIAAAVAASNAVKADGAKRPLVETVAFNAGDPSIASLAVERAAKDKCSGVLAMATEQVAADLEAVARRVKLPIVHVGSGGATRTLDPADPVFRVDPSPADRALAISELLRLRSGRSSIGLPSQTQHAWLVVEDAPWAHAIEASLRADDVAGLVTAGAAVVKPGGEVDAGELSKARSASCDRVVVLGGTKTAHAAFSALDRAAWDVPVLCLDTALDAAATQPSAGSRRHVAYVAAASAWADERHPDEAWQRNPKTAKAPMTPAALRGFVAATALIDAAIHAGKAGPVPLLRALHEGSGAREWPLFDGTGCADHWRWATWATGADGAAAPIKPAFLPDAALGLLLGGNPGARHRAAAGSTCVRIGYGGDATPRTVEADLATIGLSGTDATANELARDQILARTCSKLSRVWSRSYDGSARASLSFRITFVPDGTDTKGAPAVWTGVIAGDGPDGLHGGQSFPKELRAQALSTYLIRNAALLHKAALTPPLCATDAAYLDGSYAWNTSAQGNQRSDQIRALIDGVASTYCMKLSKEIGHLAGLSVDHSGEPRSIMVAKGGEGVSDEFAYFPPAYAKVLERTLGRVGAEGR